MLGVGPNSCCSFHNAFSFFYITTYENLGSFTIAWCSVRLNLKSGLVKLLQKLAQNVVISTNLMLICWDNGCCEETILLCCSLGGYRGSEAPLLWTRGFWVQQTANWHHFTPGWRIYDQYWLHIFQGPSQLFEIIALLTAKPFWKLEAW